MTGILDTCKQFSKSDKHMLRVHVPALQQWLNNPNAMMPWGSALV